MDKQNDTVVYSYYDRAAHQWKKGTWSKTIRNAARRGAAESLMEDRLQKGADKWRIELFKPRLELWEGEQIEPVGPSEREVGDSSIGAKRQHGTEW